MRGFNYILVLAVVLASCEKVIDVPLNDADIQTVVEGKLYDEPQQSFIKISESGSVYSNSGFNAVSGATVTVTDGTNTWTFAEDPMELGTYRDTSFVTQINTTYNMTIMSGANVYTASSSTQTDIAFDSLNYILQVGGLGQDPDDTTYFTFYNFTDDGAEENYYRVIPFVNSEKSSNFYLTDDQLFNGETFTQPFFADEMKSGDTLTAVIISMDKDNYTYFFSLSNNQGSGPFSPTPGNPVSNIEGGAIGYFGAYMTGNEQVIFP